MRAHNGLRPREQSRAAVAGRTRRSRLGAHAYHGERAHGGVVSDGCAKKVRAVVLTPAVGVGCPTGD
eukprot:2260792-Prymnesium_polylepis.1